MKNKIKYNKQFLSKLLSHKKNHNLFKVLFLSFNNFGLSIFDVLFCELNEAYFLGKGPSEQDSLFILLLHLTFWNIRKQPK